MPYQLEQKIEDKSGDHHKKDSSIGFFFEGIVFGPPRQKNAQKKNSTPHDKLISERQKGHGISLVWSF
jgi:hypothetical protein